MKPFGIKYLVSIVTSCTDEIEDEFDETLYVINELTGNVFWFDNENQEWHQSIYPIKSIVADIGKEFKEVDYFDNGYVNTDDIWEGVGYTSIIDRYPEEFAQNVNNPQEQENTLST